jgi:hypothetical protein
MGLLMSWADKRKLLSVHLVHFGNGFHELDFWAGTRGAIYMRIERSIRSERYHPAPPISVIALLDRNLSNHLCSLS